MDPDLIKNWELPTIKKIMKQGSHGRYKSTIPPVTAPAWTSMSTGKDVSHHGIMHFTDTDPYKGTTQLVSSKKIKINRIWDILSRGGYRCGVYMVPVTYPVNKINGFMYSGMLSPDKSQTYPSNLPKLKPFIPWDQGIPPKQFYDLCIQNTVMKWQNLEFLLSKINVDFLFAVESNTDSMQHYFYHGTGPTKERQRIVENYFKIVDQLLSKLLNHLDCPVLIVSDHGHGRIAHKQINMNTWLEQKGYLKHNYYGIDWSKTKAYFYKAWENYGFIKGNVNQLSLDLFNSPYFEDITDLHSFYKGPYAKNLPDLALRFAEGYTGDERIGDYKVETTIPLEKRYAGHRIHGFWACSDKCKDMNDITDVAPTALKLMNRSDLLKKLGRKRISIPEKTLEKIR